ncbi:SulP family inorganic anion transporter [candidate division CSSED10-310 bacterium]|uniref:SulP family inorganic anion transporter n=1 Tax=candidate division CSSED10-310 bacterium TaxID=2855610 RepID=A0ABV6YS16_UNCC1
MEKSGDTSSEQKSRTPANAKQVLERFFPFLTWFHHFSLERFRIDFISGLTVALVLIPQSMAYAQLAGLPAYYGLYAAFLPPMIASLFGSSYQLATGPVAVVSLMTATALEPLATSGSEAYIAYAIFLALIVGLFQFLLGVFRLGVLVNFLSHPVINGFTNAAAIIIATSQLSKLFGVYVDKAAHHYETIINVIKAALYYSHWPTMVLSGIAFAIMIFLKRLNPKIPNVLVAVVVTTIISWGIGFEHNHKCPVAHIQSSEIQTTITEFNKTLARIDSLGQERVDLGKQLEESKKLHGSHSAEILTLQHQTALLNLEMTELKEKVLHRRAQLRAYLLEAIPNSDGTITFYKPGETPQEQKTDGRRWRLKVGYFALKTDDLTFMGGGAVVGTIPQGLPRLKFPLFDFSLMLNLFSMAVIISLLGFMEAISIAKAMAAKTGQRLDPNQELIGQGLANIIGSFGQTYPVSGSFSRSAVNLQAGAVTGLSNLVSSCVVIVTLLFFTPLLYHLPQGVLAAIIMMAVIGLINVRGFIHSYQAQKYDGAISVISFVTTLAMAPHLDKGIILGVLLSLILFLLRNMKPDIAMLAKYTDGSYRNAARFNLRICKHIAVVRFNGSLFFANASYLEDMILERISDMPHLKHILLVGNGINELDASGEESLSKLVDQLREANYDISISGLNDAVLDALRRTHLYEKIGEGNFYRNVAMSVSAIYEKTHQDSDELRCPLVDVSFKGLKVSAKAKKTDFTSQMGPEQQDNHDENN